MHTYTSPEIDLCVYTNHISTTGNAPSRAQHAMWAGASKFWSIWVDLITAIKRAVSMHSHMELE